jgi:protein TonB
MTISLIAHATVLLAAIGIGLFATERVTDTDAPHPFISIVLPPPPPLGNSLDAGGAGNSRTSSPRPAKPPAPPVEVAPPVVQLAQTPEPPADLPAESPALAVESVEPPPQAGYPPEGSNDPRNGTGAGTGTGEGIGTGAGPGTEGVPGGVPGGTGPPGGGPPGEESPLLISGEIIPPILIHRVEPAYPPLPLRAKIEGTVILECVIGIDGAVESMHVLRSEPLFDEAALRAVGQWRYRPARLGTRPVKVYFTVKVLFRLE